MKRSKKGVVRKVLLSFAVLCMACLLLPQNASAATSSKKAVEKNVKAMFTAAKKCDGKSLDKYVKVWSQENCEGQNPYDAANQKLIPGYYSFLKKANKKLTYSIKNVSVKGKNAKVKVTVKYADSEPYLEKVVQNIYIDYLTQQLPASVMMELNAVNNISDAERAKIENLDSSKPADVLYARNYLKKNLPNSMKYFNSVCAKTTASTTFKATKRKTITLKMKKYGKNWKVSTANKDFENAICANLFDNANSKNVNDISSF